MSSILRVFPRQTQATPTDAWTWVGYPDLTAWSLAPDEVHVSVAFSWDFPEAERIAQAWRQIAPVTIGGPATGKPGGDFTPGLYLKPGYIITSRGCPNHCWFCNVWQREGPVRELPITHGSNILDDNLLACSDPHIHAVFDMLHRQPKPVQFTGGLEAARLRHWHVELLANLKPKQVFFAYDTPDDFEPLRDAGSMLLKAGFTTTSHTLRAYVLIGYPRDTLEHADERLRISYAAGFLPMAMLYRDHTGHTTHDWRRFQKFWARPATINRLCRDAVPAHI